ncbi:MAG: hypothetical protein IH988_05285 [Planctomycetes bacterium]|nr:hypothetical protein [Planctomycetota bacterium]
MTAHDITIAGKTWHVWEHTLDEFLRAATRERPHYKNADHPEALEQEGKREDRTWDEAWRGGSLDDLRTLHTWPEGRERLREIDLDNVQLPTVEGVKRVRCWSDDGDEFDRDRFDAGYDDCWQTRRRRRSPNGKRVIRITVELSASGSNTAGSLIWSGVAAAKLVDELESAGYRVEVNAIETSKDVQDRNRHPKSYNSVDVIRVKDADDPLNIDALLLAVAHPLFFRGFCFAARMKRPVRIPPGIGLVASTPGPVRGDIHISKTFTREGAERVVRTALKERNEQ